MKLRNYVLALIITLIAAVPSITNVTLDDKIELLQAQINEMNNKIAELAEKKPDITIADIKPVNGRIARIVEKIQELNNRVQQYEQDIRIWNDQVDNMFGASNARYFKSKNGG